MSMASNLAVERTLFSDGVSEAVKLSVIIPSYNARDLLANCLQSIFQKSSERAI